MALWIPGINPGMTTVLVRTHMPPPSPFILKWLPEIKPGGRVLDLACGKGRHTRVLLERGFEVTAVDIDASGLDDLAGTAGLNIIIADLENEPWPLEGDTFDAVIVTNYLWRPLLGAIRDAVAPGGLLLYETFASGNEQFGRPANPDFLLRDGELREVFGVGFEVLAYQHAAEDAPKPAVRQRLAARKTAHGNAPGS